jgi:hypothetical protein
MILKRNIHYLLLNTNLQYTAFVLYGVQNKHTFVLSYKDYIKEIQKHEIDAVHD